jgi:hypothetical protein
VNRPPSTRTAAERLLGSFRPSGGAPQRDALGILLFALSILVQALDGALTTSVAAACAPAQRPTWCVVADLGLVKPGLGTS